MSVSQKTQSVLDTVAAMTVTELVELKEAFKAQFKVEAAAPVMMAAAGAAAPAAAAPTPKEVEP